MCRRTLAARSLALLFSSGAASGSGDCVGLFLLFADTTEAAITRPAEMFMREDIEVESFRAVLHILGRASLTI